MWTRELFVNLGPGSPWNLHTYQFFIYLFIFCLLLWSSKLYIFNIKICLSKLFLFNVDFYLLVWQLCGESFLMLQLSLIPTVAIPYFSDIMPRYVFQNLPFPPKCTDYQHNSTSGTACWRGHKYKDKIASG